MEHVVFSAAQDGSGEEYRRVASLEEAVRLVEHLRNDVGITDPSVFALTPVPVAFKTYYRVEVPGMDEPAEPQAEPAESATSLDLAPAELSDAEALLEAVVEESERADSDLSDSDLGDSDLSDSDLSDYVFDGNSDMEVPGILPESSAIPASRSEAEADHSLGYFAR